MDRGRGRKRDKHLALFRKRNEPLAASLTSLGFEFKFEK